ncbi:MAG: hypothetical protein R3Y26_05880 [Rikenellaceae bacterium]
MENKIDQLTKKLYDEGVSKGLKDSEEIVAKAQAEASAIIAKAQAEAAQIVEGAKTDASELSKNSLRELTLASKQIVSDLKAQIVNTITLATQSESVVTAFKSDKFVKELILEVVKKWDKESVKVLIEEDKAEDIKTYFTKEIAAKITKDVEIVSEKGVGSGFKISPKEGGYYISFSDEEFDNLLKGYLKASLNSILF